MFTMLAICIQQDVFTFAYTFRMLSLREVGSIVPRGPAVVVSGLRSEACALAIYQNNYCIQMDVVLLNKPFRLVLLIYKVIEITKTVFGRQCTCVRDLDGGENES